MSGSSRGKIKEHIEGMHRNADWMRAHILEILELIGDTHPNISEGFVAIGENIDQLDELLQGIYAQF